MSLFGTLLSGHSHTENSLFNKKSKYISRKNAYDSSDNKESQGQCALQCQICRSVTASDAYSILSPSADGPARKSSQILVDQPSAAGALLQEDNPARIQESKSGKKTKNAKHEAAVELDKLPFLPQSERPRKRARKTQNVETANGLELSPASESVSKFQAENIGLCSDRAAAFWHSKTYRAHRRSFQGSVLPKGGLQ